MTACDLVLRAGTLELQHLGCAIKPRTAVSHVKLQQTLPQESCEFLFYIAVLLRVVLGGVLGVLDGVQLVAVRETACGLKVECSAGDALSRKRYKEQL
jgi:hypothetical protein